MLRVHPRISINAINNFIDNMQGISDVRKDFYKKIIDIRYEILEGVYQKINTKLVEWDDD